MRRFVVTGTPGAGKSTVIEVLRGLGHAAVGEAATEGIARRQAAGEPEPWEVEGFVDAVVGLQREWQETASGSVAQELCFFDRSPVCTLALSRYLGRAPSVALRTELDRIRRERTYEQEVFFLANLGFVTPTAARRISFEEALVFEGLHREAYYELGFQLVEVAVGTPEERASRILAAIGPAPRPRASRPSAGHAS